MRAVETIQPLLQNMAVRKSTEICFGPFVVVMKDSKVLKGFRPTGLALEFTSKSRRISPLYRLDGRNLTEGFSRGVGDFYVHEEEIPCDVYTSGFFSREIDGKAMIPLDEVLLTIYRRFSAPRNIIEVLSELRAQLPPIEQSKKKGQNYLVQAAAERGFRTTMVFSYGRTMTIQMDWAPVVDIELSSPCSVSLGIIEFKPQRDRTLGKGRWIKPPIDIPGMLLREELAKVVAGPPINYFSTEGVAALIAEYPWAPISLLTKKELEEAKVQFIRERPELHNDLKALSKDMIEAGLYSEGTQQSSVKKTAAKLLEKIAKGV
jgi:hypothetical protein